MIGQGGGGGGRCKGGDIVPQPKIWMWQNKNCTVILLYICFCNFCYRRQQTLGKYMLCIPRSFWLYAVAGTFAGNCLLPSVWEGSWHEFWLYTVAVTFAGNYLLPSVCKGSRHKFWLCAILKAIFSLQIGIFFWVLIVFLCPQLQSGFKIITKITRKSQNHRPVTVEDA